MLSEQFMLFKELSPVDECTNCLHGAIWKAHFRDTVVVQEIARHPTVQAQPATSDWFVAIFHDVHDRLCGLQWLHHGSRAQDDDDRIIQLVFN